MTSPADLSDTAAIISGRALHLVETDVVFRARVHAAARIISAVPETPTDPATEVTIVMTAAMLLLLTDQGMLRVPPDQADAVRVVDAAERAAAAGQDGAPRD